LDRAIRGRFGVGRAATGAVLRGERSGLSVGGEISGDDEDLPAARAMDDARRPTEGGRRDEVRDGR
jgi:hypothetical protein